MVVPTPLRSDEPQQADKLLVVMFDGLRWEEVFNGADEKLLNRERGGVKDVPAIRKRFWRETAEERRRALLPFLWGTVAKKGQLLGNVQKGCPIRVTNKRYFSYPGYNETLCGFADPKVDSNDKRYNANETVFEWIHKRPEYSGSIAAFASWDVFPWIFNAPRSRIPVNAGHMALEGVPDGPEVRLLNRLIAETPPYDESNRPDSLTFRTAMTYLKARKPKVLFLSFDETDAQGHAGRYDRLLDSAHKNDAFVKELWETIQTMPEYRGRTSLIVTTDHGRGPQPIEWKNHGAKVVGAEYVWAGFLGPRVAAKGERSNSGPYTQSQTAATAAALLGLDYRAAQPKAAAPYDVVR